MNKQDHSNAEGALAPRFVSVPEAGKFLGVSRATVWRLIDRGQLGTVRLGSRVLVPVKVLDEFAAALEAKSA